MMTNKLLNVHFILAIAFAICASLTFADGYIDPTSGFEFVLIRGGCYQMGDTLGVGFKDEKPVHTVCLQDFYISKYELTQEQWQRTMNKNPSFFKVCGGNCPVEEVSWNEIQDYISILNKQTGKTYRLPTEAEWEYAARSGGKEYKYSGTNTNALNIVT